MSEAQLKRGDNVDRYEIRQLLGVGGQGEVYRAYDPVLKRYVVVKALGQMTEDYLRRFAREAEVISKIRHNNVVQILDFRVERGRPFIVMEYLPGENLSARLGKGPMEISDVVDVMLAVCSGVFAAHRHGVIHRDLKPANVFLSESSEYGRVVKVLDFGIARIAEQAGQEITSLGMPVGTLLYMAPEQLTPGEEVDTSTDQYAIGMVFYRALTRQSPFGDRREGALARAIRQGEYPGPRKFRPEIPSEMERIVLRAMSVNRADRFSSVRVLGQQLLPFAPPQSAGVWTGLFSQPLAPMLPSMSTGTLSAGLSARTVTEVSGKPGREREDDPGQTVREEDVPTVVFSAARSQATTVPEGSPLGSAIPVVAPIWEEVREAIDPEGMAAMLGTATKETIPPVAVRMPAGNEPGEATPASAVVAPVVVTESEPGSGGRARPSWPWKRRAALIAVAGAALAAGGVAVFGLRNGSGKILDEYEPVVRRTVIDAAASPAAKAQDAAPDFGYGAESQAGGPDAADVERAAAIEVAPGDSTQAPIPRQDATSRELRHRLRRSEPKEWRVAINGKEEGPFTVAGAAARLLGPPENKQSMFVLRDGWTKWKAPAEVPEVVEAVRKVRADLVRKAGDAEGDAGRSEAEALMKSALEARLAGNQTEALRLFRRAHEVHPTGRSAVQMAFSEASLGLWAAAEVHFRQGLRTKDEWVRKSSRLIEARLAEVSAHVGGLRVTGPAGGLIAVGGVPKGSLPLGEMRVSEGQVDVTFRVPGSPEQSRRVTVAGGKVASVDFGR